MKYSKEQKVVLTTLFAHNPEIEVLYLTSDNEAFTEASRADSHAQRSTDQKVLTVTRDAFEAGEALVTERAQEAGEGKIKSIQTIPTEVIDLEGNSKDAGVAADDANAQTKATLSEDADNQVIADDKVKAAAGAAVKEQKQETPVVKTADDSIQPEAAERNALVSEYQQLYDKRPANNISLEKLKEKIAEKKA